MQYYRIMIIHNGRRYTNVLCVLISGAMWRIRLYVVAHVRGIVSIDTPLIAIHMCGDQDLLTYSINYITNKHRDITYNLFISQPLFELLHSEYGYKHRDNQCVCSTLFVGVSGCELLPPMQYLIDVDSRSSFETKMNNFYDI